jgi:hypothetical protein
MGKSVASSYRTAWGIPSPPIFTQSIQNKGHNAKVFRNKELALGFWLRHRMGVVSARKKIIFFLLESLT